MAMAANAMAANAYVLITVDPQKTAEVVERLMAIPKAVVHEVLGPYDVVVELEEDTLVDITSVVQSKIRPVPGIVSTVTCLWAESANKHAGGE
jgi:DNA-binding Lrp family transcriptional regulator